MCLQISFKLFFFHVKKYIINHSDIVNKKNASFRINKFIKSYFIQTLEYLLFRSSFLLHKKNNFKRIITLFILLFIYAILLKS